MSEKQVRAEDRAEDRAFHIIYKTTCAVTQKWYIGMQSTDSLADPNFLGSGQVLSRSIKAHGRDNHMIEILEHAADRKTLKLRLAHILSNDYVGNPACMNFSGISNNQQTGDLSKRKFHLLYKTTCLITNKYYIGIHSTDNIDDGYLGSGVHLTRSVKKYGKENHTREVLELCDSRDCLKVLEEEVVTDDLIKNDPQCMNLIKGGNFGDRIFGITEETRAKLSKASKDYVRTKEWYEKIVATRRAGVGYNHTDETKKKISKSNTGHIHSEEHKQKISAGGLGQKRSEETCKNISKALKGKMKGVPKAPFSEEHREAIRNARLGKKRSAETKQKLRKPKDMTKNKRQCTVDGINIFDSVKDMVNALGSGQNSRRSTNFRYIK